MFSAHLAVLELVVCAVLVLGDIQELDDKQVVSLLSMVDGLTERDTGDTHVTDGPEFTLLGNADYEAINLVDDMTTSDDDDDDDDYEDDYEDDYDEEESSVDASDGQLILYGQSHVDSTLDRPRAWFREAGTGSKMGRGAGHGQGYGKKKKPKKKKKKKFLFQRANFNIHGGTRLKGQFKSLKACKKACEKIGCLGGDYDTKTYSCYTHSTTICDDVTIAHGTIHFSAVPCDDDLDVGTIVNAEIFVGMFAPHGVIVKKVKNILDCIKKCLNAGGGVASDPVRQTILEEFQLCFGIDYDIITHKCYLHFHYWYTRSDNGREVNICVQMGDNAGNVRGNYPTTLWPRLSSIHIIFCPVPDP